MGAAYDRTTSVYHIQIQRAVNVPDIIASDGARLLPVQNHIAVFLGNRGILRMKIIWCPDARFYHNRLFHQAVDPFFQRLGIHVRVSTKRRHLCTGMNPGISAAGTGKGHGLVEYPGQHLFQRSLNCQPVGLSLPSVKSGAVILDGEFKSLNHACLLLKTVPAADWHG